VPGPPDPFRRHMHPFFLETIRVVAAAVSPVRRQ